MPRTKENECFRGNYCNHKRFHYILLGNFLVNLLKESSLSYDVIDGKQRPFYIFPVTLSLQALAGGSSYDSKIQFRFKQ